MKSKLCLVLVFLLMAVISFQSVAVAADYKIEKVVSLGADLNSSQRNQIYQIFGVNTDDEEIKFIEVTNNEEREYLEGVADEKHIGTRAISCVYVQILEEGQGIDVKMKNITWVTKESYANSLVTAGIENAKVYAAAPFPVSGTAALTGLFKAYEEATGKNIPEQAKDVATEELITAGDIGEETGERDKVDQLIKEVKEDVVREGLKDPELIKELIREKAEEIDLNLTDDQLDKLAALMGKISQLDLDISQLREQLRNIGGKIKNVFDSEEGKGIWQSIKNIWEKIINWITGLF